MQEIFSDVFAFDVFTPHCIIPKCFLALTQPFNDQCSHHIKTSQLICRINQLTGFYMMGTLFVKRLKWFLVDIYFAFISYGGTARFFFCYTLFFSSASVLLNFFMKWPPNLPLSLLNAYKHHHTETFLDLPYLCLCLDMEVNLSLFMSYLCDRSFIFIFIFILAIR